MIHTHITEVTHEDNQNGAVAGELQVSEDVNLLPPS